MKYELTLIVTKDGLADAVLYGEEVVSIRRLDGKLDEKQVVKKRPGGDGVTSRTVILDHMSRGRNYTVDEISKLLVAKGFSENTAGPALSELVQIRKLKRPKPKTYCLA